MKGINMSLSRKVISLFLMVAVIFSLVPLFALGATGDITVTQDFKDCTGESVGTEFYGTKEYSYSRSFAVAKSESPSKAVYSTDVSELAETLREAMVQRKNTVEVYYQIPVSDFDGSEAALRTVADGIVNAALTHTSKPTEGDYLRWDLGGYGLTATIAYDSDYYYLDLAYGITYYTTAEQQRELDGAVEALLAQFAFSSSTSDYDKICAIYDYICDNVVYDYENLENSEHVLKYTAYAALINKTSVCQGYATLLYRLLLECGIDCRVITGTSHNESHAWNIVRLNGVYYDLDATWDAQRDPYGYFLKCEADFDDHTRDAEYTADEFQRAYPMAKTNYHIPTDTWVDFAASSFSGGNGTQASPYVISSAEELALLAQYVNLEDSRYNRAHYILGKDIDLAGHNWMPIGVVEGNGLGGSIGNRGFFGVFDGNGHTISNMKILKAYGSIYQYGLFGMVMGTVKNVILRDAVIDFECIDKGWQASNGMGSSIDVGGLCGYLTDHGTIQNCRVTDIFVKVKAAMSLTCGGGIGSANYTNVDSVIVSGEVSGIAGRAIWVGGCIGCVSVNTTVTASGFTGTVSAESDGTIVDVDPGGSDYSYLHYVGGFCGSAGRAYRDIVMRDCYAYADVFSVYNKGTQDVGGFAGAIGIVHNKAIYENLVFKGKIVANRNGVSREETDFWQGERGFGVQNYSSVWSYKNCVVIIDDVITVTDRNYDIYQIKKYKAEDYILEDLFANILGFDRKLWYLDFNHNMILKNAHLDQNTAHKEVFDEAVSPSCGVAGLTKGKHCSVCNEAIIEQQSLPALEHKPRLDDGDCTTAVTCTLCGKVTKEAKPFHTPRADDGNCTTAIRCTVCGKVTTEAKPSHTPHADDGDCTTAITCMVCGKVTTEAKAHTPHADDGDCTTAITCTVCGKVTTEAQASHMPNADDGDCTTAITCSVCGKITTAAQEHDFTGEWNQDADGHRHICENDDCSVTDTNADHTDSENDGYCDSCGYHMGKDHNRCESNGFARVWNWITNFFRRLFRKAEICVCGDQINKE